MTSTKYQRNPVLTIKLPEKKQGDKTRNMKHVNFASKNAQRGVFFEKNWSSPEKLKNSHFYFLLNAYDNIKFWKNLMNGLPETFVFLHFCTKKCPIP